MKIILDNIIYSLQKSGGISVLWTELIKKIIQTNQAKISILEYYNAHNNLCRKEIVINDDLKLNKINSKSLKVERYKNIKLKESSKFIFCSSYYRTSSNKNAINITIVHDFTYEFFRKGFAKWVHYYQKKRAIQNAEGIICISENTKKDLLKFHPHIDENKIKVIYNGVSDDFFKINDSYNVQDVHPLLKNIENKKILVFIGHRTAYKNFDKTVDAFKKLKRYDEFHFLIIGEKLTETESQILNTELEEGSFTVLSGINNQILNKLYNKSFALLYPSSYEGFGIPLVEAMKTGLPVITSNNSCLPEIGGDAVEYLDSISSDNIVDKIKKLENEEYRKSLIEKGLIRSSKFSWDKTMTEYLDFFEELYYKN